MYTNTHPIILCIIIVREPTVYAVLRGLTEHGRMAWGILVFSNWEPSGRPVIRKFKSFFPAVQYMHNNIRTYGISDYVCSHLAADRYSSNCFIAVHFVRTHWFTFFVVIATRIKTFKILTHDYYSYDNIIKYVCVQPRQWKSLWVIIICR